MTLDLLEFKKTITLYNLFPRFSFDYNNTKNLDERSRKASRNHRSSWSEWEEVVTLDFHSIFQLTCSHQMICLPVLLMISDAW